MFVVWLTIEFQRAAVLHELLKLGGLALAELSEVSLDLLLLDCSVFLVLGSSR